MTTTVGGSYPAVNSDSDATINGLTVGKGAGNQNGNTVLGNGAFTANSTGNYCVAIGYNSLQANTTARNLSIGTNSSLATTTGGSNTVVGDSAFYTNTTGGSNAVFGYQALFSNTTGSQQTAVGYQAGYNATGQYNTFFGYQAGYGVTSGTTNTFVGNSAGISVTTGSNNTIIGGYAGNGGGLDIRTASNYIVLSDGAGNPRQVIDSSGNVLIGQTATTGAGFEVTVAGEVQYLNRNTSADGVIVRFRKQGSTVGYISTNTYSLPSDARVKKDVKNIEYGLDFISALRPVQYNTIFQDPLNESKKNFGLIAQEVEETLNNFGKSIDDVTFLEKFEEYKDGESQYGLGYQNLVPVLVKAIQELKAEVDSLKQQLATK